MNLPNKLTILRIILVPLFVAFLLLTSIPHSFLLSLIVFAAASVTDLLDGKIARKYNLATDFGKFADPLADKILVISALACFVQMGITSCLPIIIVLFREFAVTSVRLAAASKGKVVAANMWGKAKTVSQIAAIVAILLMQYFLQLVSMGAVPLSDYYDALSNTVHIVGVVLVWVTVVFTVISGVKYLYDNKDCISFS